jgi:hypothetical protein
MNPPRKSRVLPAIFLVGLLSCQTSQDPEIGLRQVALGTEVLFSQDWTDIDLIDTDDDWSGVPGIVGYAGVADFQPGQDLVFFDAALSTTVDVMANVIGPGPVPGGVAELELDDPTIALMLDAQGVNTPNIVISVSTLGHTSIRFQCVLRDLNAYFNLLQGIGFQYRLGSSGDFTRLAEHPAAASAIGPVDLELPPGAANQPLLQIRILAFDPSEIGGELTGIDDIRVLGTPTGDPIDPTGVGAATPASVAIGETTLLTVAVTPGQFPTSTGVAVTADLTSIGGAPAQPFADDGTDGDAVAGDGVYSHTAVASPAAPLMASIPVSIDDAQGRHGQTVLTLDVRAPSPALATETTLTSSNNPSPAGQAVTFTVSVTASGVPVGDGTVTLVAGGVTLAGPSTLEGGTLALTTAELAPGTHTVEAIYAGTPEYASSRGNFTQTVLPPLPGPAATATVVSTPVSKSPAGEPITFTAAVSAGGAPVTEGSVTWLEGSVTLGSDPLDGNGEARLVFAPLPAGLHEITARYEGTPSFATSSDVHAHEVETAGTQTALVSSLNPAPAGDSVTFTATVTSGGRPVTEGSVTFVAGSSVVDTVELDGAGQASVDMSTLPQGTHAITAVYLGTGSYDSSGGNLTQIVNPPRAATQTTLVATPNPSLVGSTVTFTATVTSAGAAVGEGTVTLLDGTEVLGAGEVSMTGRAVFSTSALGLGSHSITARFERTGTLDASSASLTQVVDSHAATQTSVSSAPSPSSYGQEVTVTATVRSGGSPVTEGSVTWLEGDETLGASPLDANGQARLVTSALAAGSHTIEARYEGTATFDTSIGATTHTVATAATQTALSSSLNPAQAGESVTFTATVTSGGRPVTQGSVTFVAGSTLGTVPLDDSGRALVVTSALAEGTRTVTAVYLGTGNHDPSSGTLTQVVDPPPAATRVTLSALTNPSGVGQYVTFIAAVTSAGIGVGEGTLTFLDGNEVLGSHDLSVVGTGQASIGTSALSQGSHTITARYEGTRAFAAGSASVTQVVNAQAETATSLFATPNPSDEGQTVTFRAVVFASGVSFSGQTVTFLNGSEVLGTSSLTFGAFFSWQATLEISALPVGSHTITARFEGTATLATSSASLTQVVEPPPPPTQILLSSSANPSVTGQSVTFRARVTTAGGTPVGTGTVTFLDGTEVLGTDPLSTGIFAGEAHITTSALALGSHMITARYEGAAGGGTSNVLTQVVEAPPVFGTQTSLTSSPNPSAEGQTVSFTALVSSPGGSPVGMVSFRNGTAVLGASQLVTIAPGLGRATFETTDLSAGSHTITALYPGGFRFTGSSDSVTQVVTIGLSIDDVTVVEGTGARTTALFTVSLSSAATQPVSVRASVSSSAIENGDVAAQPTIPLSFPIGSTQAAFTVSVTGDALPEDDERYFVMLSEPSNASILKELGVLTIIDDDAPSAFVSDVSVIEGQSGSKMATFVVRITRPSTVPVTIDYATVGGTAQTGSDFVNSAGVLTIPAGTLSASVAVPVLGDTVIEPSETFFLDLSNARRAVLADTRAQATIINDDFRRVAQ